MQYCLDFKHMLIMLYRHGWEVWWVYTWTIWIRAVPELFVREAETAVDFLGKALSLLEYGIAYQ